MFSVRVRNRKLEHAMQSKTMLVRFFAHIGIVYQEFISQGQIVNKKCYLEVLERLRDSVRTKRPEFRPEKCIIMIPMR